MATSRSSVVYLGSTPSESRQDNHSPVPVIDDEDDAEFNPTQPRREIPRSGKHIQRAPQQPPPPKPAARPQPPQIRPPSNSSLSNQPTQHQHPRTPPLQKTNRVAAAAAIAKAEAEKQEQRNVALELHEKLEKERNKRVPPHEKDDLRRGMTDNVRERFHEASDPLICGMCGMVFLEPVQIAYQDCNHIFCEKCLDQRTVFDQFCPECGYHFETDQVVPSKIIRELVYDQLVICYFEPAGCEQKVRYRDLAAHEQTCVYNPKRVIPCECNEMVEVAEYRRHLDTSCPEHKIECPHDCGESMKRKAIKPHEDSDCPLRPVRCDFHPFGCKWKGAFSLKHKHNKGDFDKHMAQMVNKIQDIEEEKTAIAQNGGMASNAANILRDRQEVKHLFSNNMSVNAMSVHQMMEHLGRTDAIDQIKALPRVTRSPPPSQKITLNPDGVKRNIEVDRKESQKRESAMEKMHSMQQDGIGLALPTLGRSNQPRQIIDTDSTATVHFNRPGGVCFLSDYQLCVSDSRACYIFDVKSKILINTCRPHTRYTSWRPRALCYDNKNDRILVTDSQFDMIHAFKSDGTLIGSFSGKDEMKMNLPHGITYFEGKTFVADTRSQRVQIFDDRGEYMGTVHEDSGEPMGICAAPDGKILVTVNTGDDSFVTLLDPNGRYIGTFGNRGTEAGGFGNSVRHITVDNNYNVFVTSQGKHRVQVFRQKQQVDANSPLQYRAVASFGDNSLVQPSGIAITKDHLVAIADEIKNKIYIY